VQSGPNYADANWKSRRAARFHTAAGKEFMNKKTKQKRAAVGQLNGGNGEGTPIEVPEIQYQRPPADMHIGRLAWIVCIGTQPSNFPDGKSQRKVIFCWELPNEKAVFVRERGEEPYLVSSIYSLSLGERSNLYRDIVSWKGKGAIDRLRKDLALLLGDTAWLNVIHKTTKKNQPRAAIIGVNPVPKSTRIPAQITPSLQYSIRDGRGGAFNRLPDWIRKLIEASEEFTGARPSASAIAERNMREATDNALRKTAPAKPHAPVRMSESHAEEGVYSKTEMHPTVTSRQLTLEEEEEISALLR